MSTQNTRRQFLRNVGAASAAACVAPLFTPYLYSSEQPKREKSALEKLQVGAVGVSEYRAGIWGNEQPFDGRGTFIGRRAGEFGAVVACADVYLPFAKRFAAYYPNQCKAYQDYERIIEDPTIDVVTIGTPDHWHTKIAVEAMRAGKSVYVEKPLTLTMEESRLIEKVAKETGAVVQVGSQQRSEFDTFLTAAAIVRSGRLGSNIEVVCSCPVNEAIGKVPVYQDRTPFKPEPIPEGLNWDKWLGPTPVEDYFLERCFYNFRYWTAYSGGAITDWGGHNVDFAVWVLNRYNDAPVEITGTGKFPNIEGWYDAAEEFNVRFKYQDGAVIHLQSGDNFVLLSGELGRIRVNRGRLTGKPVEDLTSKDREELKEFEHELLKGKSSGDHMRNFFESIEDGAQPVSDVATTISGINMCHMANICIRTGGSLHWNQQKYSFEEEEANAHISRPSRAGYEVA
ncbi:MAG: Gfo/Idh/MocA family oxidoreductase [Thermoguttaceae bacterium]|nr:Gfo/Idh/MocA family oxidoreductase [Thermoguttaceae bacterium]